MFILINYEYFDLFAKDMTDKKISIVSDDGSINITNTELHQQQFELTESLCSESELRFGSCEASMIKFTVNNVFIPMDGKWLTVTMTVEGHADKPLQIGRYKVFSDIATADRTKRDVVAYDAMYDIIGADVAEWYNTVLPNNDSTVTLKQFRTSLINYFGLEQEDKTLVNDDIIVKKTIQITPSSEEDTGTGHISTIGEALSGCDVLTSICEINGCFGHIGRDGKFHWIYLEQDIGGLYPSEDLYPSENLYPASPKGTSIGKNKSYIDCQWESFTAKSINKIQIRQEENDIGKIYPDTPPSNDDNCYIIQGNFLVYGKSSDELAVIAQNIFNKIANIIYRPFDANVIGNPCFEVGDAVRISTKYELVESYILQRTLKGIQTLRDTYSANGTEWYTEKVNGIHTSIMQIKGKANILTRTIEETRLEMYDIEAGLNSKISMTAEQLTTEFTAKLETWDTTGYDISYTGNGAPEIPVENGKYYLDEETGGIYVGHIGGWNVAALYEWDSERYAYYITSIYSEYEDKKFPPKIENEDLEDYGYVSTLAPQEEDAQYGSVYLEVDELYPYYDGSMLTWYEWEGYTEWNLIGYASVMTLPEMASKINQTAYGIELKVNKGDVTSQLLIEPTDIYLKTGRLRIETDNLEINKDGSSGEILSRNLSESGVTKETARYIKFNTGGLEGGYGNDVKCKIVCNDKGLEFRGKILTFCMDTIKVGEGMNSTSLKTAYTGDIAYAVKQTNGTVSNVVLKVRNGMIMAND